MPRLLLLLAAAAVLVSGCGQSSSSSTFSGAVLHEPYTVPATALVDTDGQAFSLADSTDHRLTLVFFGYTHCPDECPTTMAMLASAVGQLDAADRADVQVVFVTTDPGRDTGATLRRWLDRYDSDFVGLTGPLATIKQVATDVGVTVDRGPTRPSGSYDVSHGTQVLGVDGKNDVPVVWTLGTTAPELAHDIHQVLS